VRVRLDRRTGAVRTASAGAALIQDGAHLAQSLPVLVSPGLRKALVVQALEQPEADASLITRRPVAADSTFNPVSASRQASYRARFAGELAANPRLRAFADFALAFEPVTAQAAEAGVSAGVKALVWVVDLQTGDSREVARLTGNSAFKFASFSQDGGKLSLITEATSTDPMRDRFDGALMSEEIYRDVTGNVPPAQNYVLQSNTLTVIDLGSGDTRTLRAADGGGTVYASTSWSTDNQTLMVKVNQPGRARGRRYPQYTGQFQSGSSLRFYNTAMQEIRRLETSAISDITMQATFVSPDEVIIQNQYRLDRHPYYFNLRSGELRVIADRAGTFATVVSTNRSREIVFAYSSFTDPVDLYRMRWDGTAFARLTWFNEEVRKLSRTKQYPVSFTLRDRSTHTGVLILPADVPFPPKNVPIVAWQEGGPTEVVQNNWFALVESPHALLPNFGFGLLVVPLYGRFGLGPERFNALADGTNYGQIDIDAQAEIVAQLRARGWARKVGIVGCSYGGYFVTQSLARHPTTYNAGHTMCSLVDLFTEWSRGYAALAPWFQGLPPAFALTEYQRDSPAYNAGRVRTPLLAFHGTDDFLPITVMQNFMLQVINNRVPAKMLKFQDADHGFLRRTPSALSKAYELYGAQEQILWFRTYLRN
jgi:dipeptidyl aminopeptidase/acylaminoacyl peptidase